MRPSSSSRLLVACLALATIGFGGCGDDPTPIVVEVEFELQAINANATSWGFGVNGGEGFMGFGSVNETEHEAIWVTIGQPVFCKAFGSHWDSSDPGHQLLCRILVDGEEIYLCADQGTPTDDTAIECGGPVYIPQEDEN